MRQDDVLEQNARYWNRTADEWFGVTALPELGCFIPREEELHLFGDVSGKKLLELGCGSGHSLKYHADRGAGELWGVDLSSAQLANAKQLLSGREVTLIQAAMEQECGLPQEYFDCVYSIYSIGWTTDLAKTFQLVHSYLRQGGSYIFSWHHPLVRCTGLCDGKVVLSSPYLDEAPTTLVTDSGPIIFTSWNLSTYVNALAQAGFLVERIVERTAEDVLGKDWPADTETRVNPYKAQFFPQSVVFKARKR